MPRAHISSLGAAALLLIGVASSTAEAQGRRDGYGAPPPYARSYVTAYSRWGNGQVTGPVRAGKWGPEVRLPGGTWIACVRSCSETLRKESIDFWQSHNDRTIDPGPGYFRWEW